MLRSARDKAELLQLAVNPGSAPARVLVGQASDQHTNLLGDLRSAAARPGTPMPVKAKTSAVPADNRLGLHDDKDILPARRTVPQHRPEKPVRRIQFWAWPLPFEHNKLLPQREHFKSNITSIAKKDSDRSNQRKDEFDHELTLVPRQNGPQMSFPYRLANC
jgi:hypothetical protein